MTPENQRIAIAEACGVNTKHARFWFRDHGGYRWWECQNRADAEQMYKLYGKAENPVEEFTKVEWLPNYPGSLDAMHEAISHRADLWASILAQLATVVNVGPIADPERRVWLIATAKANQWAEAFLRALGEWK